MKKLISLILLSGVIVLAVQCKKEEDPQPNPPPTKYSVDYKFQIAGDYKDLKIVYFEKSMVKKEVNSPAVPWQMIDTEFASGDSVDMRITFVIPQGSFTYNYAWSINILGGGQTLNYEFAFSQSGNAQQDKLIELSTWNGKLQ